MLGYLAQFGEIYLWLSTEGHRRKANKTTATDDSDSAA